MLDVGGVRVAELSATFDLNDRAYEKKWLLNEVRFNDTPCDFTLIEQLIASTKAQKADIITLHAHWGWEFELYPHPKTVEYAHKLAEMGVDVIVGTHPARLTADGKVHLYAKRRAAQLPDLLLAW